MLLLAVLLLVATRCYSLYMLLLAVPAQVQQRLEIAFALSAASPCRGRCYIVTSYSTPIRFAPPHTTGSGRDATKPTSIARSRPSASSATRARANSCGIDSAAWRSSTARATRACDPTTSPSATCASAFAGGKVPPALQTARASVGLWLTTDAVSFSGP